MFPALIASDRFTFAARVAVGIVLVFLLQPSRSARRPLSVLDWWLWVVMFAWFGEVFAGAVMSSGRSDVGWYVGRAYGVMDKMGAGSLSELVRLSLAAGIRGDRGNSGSTLLRSPGISSPRQ